MEAASAVGTTFTVAAIAAVLNSPQDVLEHTCEVLCRRGQFIVDTGLSKWPDGTLSGCYRFSHALYPEVLYSRIGSARRARLHQDIGARIEQGFASQTYAVATVLARHFELSHDPGRAVQYLQQAAETALARYANHEAAQLLHHALFLLDTQSLGIEGERRKLELLLILGRILIALEGYAAAVVKETFEQAWALCQSRGDAQQQFLVLRGLAGFHLMRAEYKTAQDLCCKMFDLAHNATPPDGSQSLEAHLIMGIAFYQRGDFAAASEHLQNVLRHYDYHQHESHIVLYGVDPGVVAYCFDAWSLWALGDLQQAFERVQQALALAEEIAYPHSLTQCRSLVSYLHLLCGDTAQTLMHAKAALNLAEQHGFPFLAAGAEIRYGWALVHSDEIPEGIERINLGLKRYRAAGALGALTSLLTILAQAYTYSGQTEEGLSVVDEALTLVETHRECFCEAELWRLKGVLLQDTAHAQDSESVERCLQQALIVARRQNAIAWELRSAMSLAQLRLKQHQPVAAYHVLEPICKQFSPGCATADLKQARRLLDQLTVL